MICVCRQDRFVNTPHRWVRSAPLLLALASCKAPLQPNAVEAARTSVATAGASSISAPVAPIETTKTTAVEPLSLVPLDPDLDGDGLANERDGCPREPGKAAEDAAVNGCPSHVRWHDDSIEILAPITFEIDKAHLEPSSFAVLDELRDVMEAHREIPVFEIQGHYPSLPDRTSSLSKWRAQSVRDYLIKRGVSNSRLRAVGYGDSKPLVRGDTKEGRARNRRIEVHFEKAPAP